MLFQRIDHVGRLGRQRLVHPDGEGVDVGQHADVGRRALQHGDVARTRIGQRWNESHCRRTAADHDDLLARVVEVLGPVLGVDDGALEVLRAGELRRVALVVVVVAAASEQEVAGDLHLFAVALDAKRPPVVRVGPVGGDHLLAVPDVLVDAGLGDRLLEIVHDRRAVGDGLLGRPRLEPESEGEHVGVRADARVLEQVPGAAEVLAALQDEVALVGTAVLQMPGRADAGDAGSHDDDVDKFGHAVNLSTLCRISQHSVEKIDML